jgi:hypothetical protein
MLIDLTITPVKWLGKALTAKWEIPVIPREGEKIILAYWEDATKKIKSVTLPVCEVRYYPLPPRPPKTIRELDFPAPTYLVQVYLDGTRASEELADVVEFANPHRLDWKLVKLHETNEVFTITSAGQRILNELPEAESQS